MKKLTILIIISFFLFFCANNSTADDFSYELSANQTALDSEFEAVINTSDTMIMPGISVLYKSDDYKILFLKALIGNEKRMDELPAIQGVQGAWGDAEKRDNDGDILNLGFTCYASYDLSKSDLNNFPITLASSLFISPEPLSFGNTDKFIELSAECSWKILDQAALVLSYRYIEIGFENQTKWHKSDNDVYLGLKFFF